MRTEAAADLGMQNIDTGNQISLPGMDAAPSTALTIKAKLPGQAKAASTLTLIETSCSRILHLTFNDSHLKQPTCTFVIFGKVNLLILETCLQGERQFAGRLGRKKVSSFLMKSIFIEGERMRNELQNSEEPMRVWKAKIKQEEKKKVKNVHKKIGGVGGAVGFSSQFLGDGLFLLYRNQKYICHLPN